MKETGADDPAAIWSLKQRENLARQLSDQSWTRYKKCAGRDDAETQEQISRAAKEKAIEALYEGFIDRYTARKESFVNAKWGIEKELEQKLPPVMLPEQTAYLSISPMARACAAVSGVLYGGLIFGLIFRLAFGEGLTGALLGAMLLAGFFTYATENEKWMNNINKIMKIVSAWFLIKKVTDFFTGRAKKDNSFITYLIVFFPWIFFKTQRKRVDETRCKERLYHIYLNWLSGVEVVGTCIAERILREEKMIVENDAEKWRKESEAQTAKLGKLIHVLLTSQIETDEYRSNLIKDLQSLACEMVYSRARAESPPDLWKKDMEDLYKTYGNIQEGDAIEIWEEALLENGRVIEKGTVRKRRVGH